MPAAAHTLAPTIPKRVLLVDDYEDSRHLFAEYLEYCGFVVDTAADGAEAIAKAAQLRPDAIVMDLSLPVIDGCEATRRLKARPETQSIPVVAFTAHVLAAWKVKALQAGCDRFLSKPCSPSLLAANLNQLLGLDS